MLGGAEDVGDVGGVKEFVVVNKVDVGLCCIFIEGGVSDCAAGLAHTASPLVTQTRSRVEIRCVKQPLWAAMYNM